LMRLALCPLKSCVVCYVKGVLVTMDTVPDDALSEIFSHLSPEDLLKAEVVCRRWKSLAESDHVQFCFCCFVI